MVEVSFVVIAKNEETIIERCLESCWEAAAVAGVEAEVILADSNSSDRTLERARPLCSAVLRLPDVGAPFAGRTVGSLRARAPFIQFLDGDMTLDHEWIRAGIAALRSDPAIGAVAGQTREAQENENLRRMNRKAENRERAEVSGPDPPVLWGGGMLVRAEALSKCGGFHPFLVGLEQLDVSWRLRRSGYRLRRMPNEMTTHYGYLKALTLREEARKRWKTYFLGEGFLVRFYMRRYRDLAPRLVAREIRGVPIVGLEAVALLGAGIIGGPLAMTGAFVAGSVLAAFALARPPGNRIADLAKSGLWAHLSVAGVALGAFRPNRLPEEYPHDRVSFEPGARASGGPTGVSPNRVH